MTRKHAFSVEMKSKDHMKSISVSNGPHGGVLLEGYLGELQELGMVEEVILELKGSNGTLRIDLDEAEIRKMLAEKKPKQP